MSWFLSVLAYTSLAAFVLSDWLNPVFTSLTPIAFVPSTVFYDLLKKPSKENVRSRGWILAICLIATSLTILALALIGGRSIV